MAVTNTVLNTNIVSQNIERISKLLKKHGQSTFLILDYEHPKMELFSGWIGGWNVMLELQIHIHGNNIEELLSNMELKLKDA